MRTSSFRTHALIAVVVVPAVLAGLAGCGSADKGADPDSGTVAPKNPDAADPVKVPDDLCGTVSAAELSEALGVTVTTEVGPSGDCEFDAADPRGISGSIGAVAYADTNGGYDGYVSGLDASLKDPVATDVSGLGDAAVVKVGLPAMGGSENLMAAGVVDHGAYLLQVTLVQAQNLPAPTLATAAEKTLRLIDAKAAVKP